MLLTRPPVGSAALRPAPPAGAALRAGEPWEARGHYSTNLFGAPRPPKSGASVPTRFCCMSCRHQSLHLRPRRVGNASIRRVAAQERCLGCKRYVVSGVGRAAERRAGAELSGGAGVRARRRGGDGGHHRGARASGAALPLYALAGPDRGPCHHHAPLCLYIFEHLVGANIHRYPMFRTSLECKCLNWSIVTRAHVPRQLHSRTRSHGP